MMEKIDIKKAQTIAKKKGLSPGKVKGVDSYQFTKGQNSRLDTITWEELDKGLAAKKLGIYESGGYLKIMKA